MGSLSLAYFTLPWDDRCLIGTVTPAGKSWCRNTTASQRLGSAVKEFYSSLYSPPSPRFESIKDPVLRKYSRSKTGEKVADGYRGLYDAITIDRGGYDGLTFLGHNPDEVVTL